MVPSGIKHGSSHALQGYNRLSRLTSIITPMFFGVTRIDEYTDASPAQFVKNWQKQVHPLRRNERTFYNYLPPSMS